MEDASDYHLSIQLYMWLVFEFGFDLQEFYRKKYIYSLYEYFLELNTLLNLHIFSIDFNA